MRLSPLPISCASLGVRYSTASDLSIDSTSPLANGEWFKKIITRTQSIKNVPNEFQSGTKVGNYAGYRFKRGDNQSGFRNFAEINSVLKDKFVVRHLVTT